MYAYSAFGGFLASEVDLPLLRHPGTHPATHTLRIGHHVPDAEEFGIGEAEVQTGIRVRLYRTASGYRLRYDDTGVFDVSEDGARITWFSPDGVDLVAARMDICGRVLALALHASGRLCLHGSAVSMEGGTIGFLGPKYHGKSTLAEAMTQAGAALVTDDVLAISPAADTSFALPGTPRMRLWADSAATLRGLAAPESGGKHELDPVDSGQLLTRPDRLASIYILEPVTESQGGQAVERETLAASTALMTVFANATLGSLVDVHEAGVLLGRAAAVVRSTPVFRLRYVRDFGRLGEVVERIGSWHSHERPSAGIK